MKFVRYSNKADVTQTEGKTKMKIAVIYMYIYSIYHIYYVTGLGCMSSSQFIRIPTAGGEQVAYSHRLPLACRMSQSYCRLRLCRESAYFYNYNFYNGFPLVSCKCISKQRVDKNSSINSESSRTRSEQHSKCSLHIRST